MQWRESGDASGISLILEVAMLMLLMLSMVLLFLS